MLTRGADDYIPNVDQLYILSARHAGERYQFAPLRMAMAKEIQKGWLRPSFNRPPIILFAARPLQAISKYEASGAGIRMVVNISHPHSDSAQGFTGTTLLASNFNTGRGEWKIVEERSIWMLAQAVGALDGAIKFAGWRPCDVGRVFDFKKWFRLISAAKGPFEVHNIFGKGLYGRHMGDYGAHLGAAHGPAQFNGGRGLPNGAVQRRMVVFPRTAATVQAEPDRSLAAPPPRR